VKNFRYPWPASALGYQEMALLHSARETADTRVPITKLIAHAVRAVYGTSTNTQKEQTQQTERK